MKYAIPLSEALIDELTPFWAGIFGNVLPDLQRAVFLGAEEVHNRGALYLQREGAELAGTCVTIHSKRVPTLAGMAEVATGPAYRGRGIASQLCQQALSDFRAAGGEALFLGTVNPVAARVYHRLGWRKLAGANVMVNVTSGASPEEFLVDTFRQPGQVTVGMADPAVRIPMIPLILTPHDSQVLDANVGVYSCRYRTPQNSCMGLYPRYVRTTTQGAGAFFAARTEDGRVVGLASALPVQRDPVGRQWQVDGFVHQRFASAFPRLIESCSFFLIHSYTAKSVQEKKVIRTLLIAKEAWLFAATRALDEQSHPFGKTVVRTCPDRLPSSEMFAW